MKKVITVIISILLVCVLSVEVFAASVSGIRLVNNTSVKSDYKLNKASIQNIFNSVKVESEVKESFTSDAGKEDTDNDIKKYLIDNNIISREKSISVNKNGMTLESADLDMNAMITKTDFLMGLYKTCYGVIDSRPFVINIKSKRAIDGKTRIVSERDNYTPSNYNGSDSSFNFDEGDYEVYISPNVQELYLTKWLSADIIDKSEIQDQHFLDEYENLISDGAVNQPEWSNELQPFMYNTSPVRAENQLGKAWKFSGIYRYFMKSPKTFEITREQANFFVNESINKLEVYRYINKIINPNAETIPADKYDLYAYKYGNKEILDLNEDDRNMILYLISKGIIDRNQLQECSNFEDTVTNEFAFNLFYRIHEESNRVPVDNIENITLTDSDKYFMDNGFMKNNVSIYEDSDIREPITLSIKRVDSKFTSFKSEYIPKFGDREDTSAESSEEKLDYEIVKLFPRGDLVEYESKPINSLTEGGPISSVEKTSDGIKVTFKVKAVNDIQALSILDSKITFSNLGTTDKMLETVTKVTTDGKSVTYVGARELRNVDGEIATLTNKVLKNKITVYTAVILNDTNMSMIGNKIIHSDEPMIIINNDETYYNLEAVVNLMSNAYLSKLDPGKIFMDPNLPKESIVPVTGVGSEIERTTMINGIKYALPGFRNNEQYFNINLVSRGLSTLTREYTIKDKKVTVIVDWAYSLPGDDDKIRNLFEKVDEDFSVKEASEFLFTRPSDETAQDWWDNNIAVSNALANLLYNTNGVEYITSGWLKPDVTILIDDSDLQKADVLKEIFGDIQFKPDFLKEKLNGSTTDFDVVLFNGGSGDLTQRRSFLVMNGVEKNGCYVYENLYITSPTGAIYKSVAEDKRVKYEDGELKVTGRRNAITEDITPKTEVSIVDETFFLEDFDAEFSKYYKLISTTPITGKVKEVRGRYTIQDENGNDALYNKINDWETKFKLNTNDFKAPKDYSNDEFTGQLPLDYYKPALNYLVGSDIITHAKAMTPMVKNIGFDINSDEANAFPVLYLSRNDFTVQDGKIVRRKGNPYLEQGNVFFSGLNSTLISRLIDNQVGNITFNKLPLGSTVIIQDIKYKKTNKGLESEPIDNPTLAKNVMENRGNSDELNRIILSQFKGLQILYSARPVSFTSYITKCDVGGLVFDTPHKTGYKESSNFMYAEDKDNKVDYTGQELDSVCIRIDLDPSVEFYLLDDTNNVYAMRNASSKYSDGYIDNISIFSEDLGFGTPDDIFMELTNNEFRPLANFRDIFKEYQLIYHSAMKGDIIAILQFVFMWIMWYFIVASWVGCMILRGKLGLNILLAIRNPSGVKGADGFDLVKFFTFGIWNLDSEPGLGPVFLADLLMFILLYITLNCGTVIRNMFY